MATFTVEFRVAVDVPDADIPLGGVWGDLEDWPRDLLERLAQQALADLNADAAATSAPSLLNDVSAVFAPDNTECGWG